MIFAGIDPGQDGALVLLQDSKILSTHKFKCWKELFDVLKQVKEVAHIVCIEKLWAMPLRGSMGNFSLGGNYTTWKSLMEILELSFIEAAPATWQPKILNTSKRKSKETKPLAIKYVNKRFPELKFGYKRAKDIKESSGIADAICIALYGRMVHSGLNN